MAASILSAPMTPQGGGKGNGKRVRQLRILNGVCIFCQKNYHWKRERPQLVFDEGTL
ncbi:UNVERIFIED_CONTAM: hypothetical protein Sradi_0885500 [Sesamum radiatum]|uniref:Uncharacterized protein n=1 Tax=Sesamum radiatum TaxID=300843 RepID=A0AAW2V2I9_SESRA